MPASVPWAVAGPLLLAGIGGGFVIALNQTLKLQDVPPRDGGTAAGVLPTGQRIGTAIGIALAGEVFFGQLTVSCGRLGQRDQAAACPAPSGSSCSRCSSGWPTWSSGAVAPAWHPTRPTGHRRTSPLLRNVVGRTLDDDMQRMEAIVQCIGLDWTVVRPAGLFDVGPAHRR